MSENVWLACIFIQYLYYEALPGEWEVGGDTCSLVPLKKFVIFLCSPKSKSWFSLFPVPQNCICSPVPFSFRLLFPCSPEINGLIPLFPKTPGRALSILLLSWPLIKVVRILRERCSKCQSTHNMRCTTHEKALMQFADIIGPDQRVYLCSLIWVFSVCRHILQYPLVL